MTLIAARWVGPPRSYSQGRNRPLQGVALHCTEGSEGTASAESGAAYDKRRTDGTSTHEFADADTALAEVRPADRSHALRFHGNEIFYSIEICARAGQSLSQWSDETSRATLDIVSQRLAAIWLEQGWPLDRLVRLTVAQTRAAYYAPAGQRPIGVVGHVDVSKAFPEDQGDHWDPGPNFPWGAVLAAARAYALAEVGQANESEQTMRYVFTGFAGTPAGLDSKMHITNSQTYRVMSGKGEFNALMVKAGEAPFVVVTPADVPEAYRTYPLAVAQLCGRPDEAPTAPPASDGIADGSTVTVTGIISKAGE